MVDQNGNPIEYYALKKARGKPPIPLKDTAFNIEIRSGLAMVEMVRKFKNVEKKPIEATITFPVPFDAVVYKVQTKVGDRVLTGQAQAKAEARETYEDAIDNGKPAVLHEELLKGLHMLSVANVAPGVEVEVAMFMAVPLVLAEGNGRFRFPLTIGQIYGTLPLVESDNVLLGGPKGGTAKVAIRSETGSIFVNGEAASNGVAKVSLSDPMEIEVVGLYGSHPADSPDDLVGRAADGRAVRLSSYIYPDVDCDLRLEVMIDVSGSMQRPAFNSPEASTKYQAVMDGLRASAGNLRKADEVSVWTFADNCRRIDGGKSKDQFSSALAKVQRPSGGTQLAAAVAHVISKVPEAHILLITDGNSGKQFEIEKAVASGATITVVLVGADAMEVGVGYLAAMTGGEMFIARGSAVQEAVELALQSMRNAPPPIEVIEGTPLHAVRIKAGTHRNLTWTEATEDSPAREGFAEAIAAYAANQAIMGMKEAEAKALSASEGLVSHLTSIVLVDEAAEAVDGIPATRKVALPDASTSYSLVASGMPRSAAMAMTYASPQPESLMASPLRGLKNMLVGSKEAAALCAGMPSSMAIGSARTEMPKRDFDRVPVGGGYVPTKSSDAAGWVPVGSPIDGRIIERETTIKERVLVPRPITSPSIPNWPPMVPPYHDPFVPMDPFPGEKFEWPTKRIWDEYTFQPSKSVADMFSDLKGKIDWDADPEALAKGEVNHLPTWVQTSIVLIAQEKAMRDLAKELNVFAHAVVIALLASLDEARTAGRIARSVLSKASPKLIEEAKAAVGI